MLVMINLNTNARILTIVTYLCGFGNNYKQSESFLAGKKGIPVYLLQADCKLYEPSSAHVFAA